MSSETEYLRWQRYWERQQVDNRPDNVMDGLHAASESIGHLSSRDGVAEHFRNVASHHDNLRKMFSALNCLRSTMAEERQLYINQDTLLDFDEEINEFRKFNRRLSTKSRLPAP